MANKRDIKRRIVSVANTQKITRAMKLVAAAKFARASHAVNAARPYSRAFQGLVQRFVASLAGENVEHPLLRQVEQPKKTLLVVVGSDRGLCGGLNSNLGKRCRVWADGRKHASAGVLELFTIGRKATSWGAKQKENVVATKEKLLDRPNYDLAEALADELAVKFANADYDAIFIGYNEFKSALAQQPTVDQLLPIALPEASAASKDADANVPSGSLLVEPSKERVLATLLRRQLTSKILQVLLESAASEQGSRMTAMDSATTNAGEVRKKLTLKYNRVRQAAITKELIEIISGAEAL